MIKNKMIIKRKMKKATLAWDEVAKWILFLLLLIAVIFVIVLLFGGAEGVWERIKNVLSLGAG